MSVEEHAHTASTPQTPPAASSPHLVWLAGVVFVVSVGALVALEVTGRPTITLVALVTPVITGLLVSGHVSTVTRQQNVAIDKIERQTNGVLDERIHTQVVRALEAAAPLPAIVVDDLTAPPAGQVGAVPPSESTMPREFRPLAPDPGEA